VTKYILHLTELETFNCCTYISNSKDYILPDQIYIAISDGRYPYISLLHKIHIWCNELQIKYSIDFNIQNETATIIFDEKEPAFLFKLTWCGSI
jgi:hypothetical protein